MGTRNYAKAIADIIDPDGTLFRERILSRDESGSFTQKSIQRLFPCDDSMVMVVDDRADVWNWSENLIKVRPFVFFRDTGDINDPAKLVASASESPILSKGAGVGAAAEEDSDGMWRDLMKDELPPPVPPESPTVPTGGDHEEDDDDRLMSDAPFDTHEQDSELITLSRILGKVHGQFYRRLDEHGLDNVSLDDKIKLGIDVKAILRGVKEEVFKNCVIVFSGVIPQGAPVEKSEIWQFARTFGAKISTDINETTTHLVAAKPGTDKVRAATKMQKHHPLHIVTPEWLFKSVHAWERQDEFDYQLKKLENEAAPPSKGLDAEYIPEVETDISQLECEGDSFLNEDDILGIGRELYDELGGDYDDSGDDGDESGADDSARKTKTLRTSYSSSSMASAATTATSTSSTVEDTRKRTHRPLTKDTHRKPGKTIADPLSTTTADKKFRPRRTSPLRQEVIGTERGDETHDIIVSTTNQAATTITTTTTRTTTITGNKRRIRSPDRSSNASVSADEQRGNESDETDIDVDALIAEIDADF
eukprot:Partr_v1_DN28498_c3_g1_i6_m41679 putative RNA polymerase II